MALKRAADPGLGRIIKILETIADPATRAQLSQRLGRKAIELIDDSIKTSTDCYGNPMPPRVDDGAPPLQGLRGTFSATVTTDGLRIGCSKWYSVVHNRGWTIKPTNAANLKFRLPSGKWVSTSEIKIPKRQLAPSESTGGLGRIWGPALNAVVADFMREYLRGR